FAIGVLDEALNRSGPFGGEHASRIVDPALELAGVAEVHTVEKWPAIYRDRRSQVAGRECGAKSMNVAINDVAVDAQVAVGPDDRRVAELLPNSIYELVECVARATGVGLGPQHRQDAVARHTAVRVGRQESKKGQALSLVG